MRLTRNIQQWEIETYNPTRPNDDKFVNSDYMCKKSAYDRDIINKLGQLEDIEDELGIDLITLFKALKEDEFYSKHPKTGEVSLIPLPILYYCCCKWNIGCSSMIFNEQENRCDSWDCDPKDYNKTWSLRKEKLL